MRRPLAGEVDAATQNRMWDHQRGGCAVTGLQMLQLGHKRHPLAATVTWIPSYTKTSPVLCAYFINVLLRSFPLHEVVEVMRKASDNARALLTQPAQAYIQNTEDTEIPADVLRQLARALNNSLRRATSRKKLQRIDKPHSLTMQQVRDMWLQQHGKCAISAMPLVGRVGGLPSACMVTIDRICSSDGYHASNCQLLSFAMNHAKSDHPQDRFIDILATMHM